MPVFVTDPDAFDKLVAVEGASWGRYTLSHPDVRESFLHVRKAYCDAVCELRSYGKDPAAVTELMDNNTIYGESGYARYSVRNNGEIVLDSSSTRSERVQKARAAGFRVM